MRRRPPTARQVEVVRAIYDITCRLGMPPTLRELMAPLGIASTNCIAQHLGYLVLKGLVRRASPTRGIFLTPAAAVLIDVPWSHCSPMGPPAKDEDPTT